MLRKRLSSILVVGLMASTIFTFNSGVGVQKVMAVTDPQPIYPGNEQWQLTFSDEFNGTTVDTSKWTIRDTDQYSYHDKNYVSVGNGNLNLKIDKDPVTGKVMLGRIDTHGYDTSVNVAKWDQKFGFFECRTDIPPTEKTYFAFWLQNYPGVNNIDGTGHDGAEIDITETAKSAEQTMSTIHWDGYGTSHRQASSEGVAAPNIHTGFHTYGMEWDETSLKFYFDGQLTWTYSGVGVPWVKEIIILSSGSANWVDGNINNAALPVYCNVDYVRVWSKASKNEAINGGFESGQKTPWTSWNTSGISSTNSYEGSYCGYVTKSSSLEQVITGLSPNTTYTVTGYLKTENVGDSVSFGVKDYGGTEISTTASTTSYQKYSLTFTTGANKTTAKIYAYKSGTTLIGKAFIDNVVVQ